jgi:protocatechuate 3,4-dioxygenase beta subunit
MRDCLVCKYFANFSGGAVMKAHVLWFLTFAVVWVAAIGDSFVRSARAGADAPATIRGTVVDDKQQPIEAATVSISTAGVRVGASCFCPSCYADCGKRAKSDAHGAFLIASLDPTLVFRVLFVAKGFEPKFVKVDPLKETSVTVAMKARPNVPDNPRQIVSGHVVGPHGEPLVGALVEPWCCKQGERRWWGSLPGVDPLDVTDLQGRFQIIADKPADGFDLEVTARALAKKRFALVPVAKADNRLQLATGATVRGRVVDHGKPVAGVEVGLAQVSRNSETFLGAAVIGTDADGRFLFANVSANDDYFVYGIMDSLSRRGGIPEKRIHVGADESETDVGDLAIEPAFRLSGRIALSDGKAIPAHTRVLISRDGAWDSQIVDAAADGTFSAFGIPRGIISINANIPAYHDSPKNKSLDRLHGASLKGFIEKDIDRLTVLFEPGKLVRPSLPRDSRAQQALIRSFERLKLEPPMGVTADLKAFDRAEPEVAEHTVIELPARPRKPPATTAW